MTATTPSGRRTAADVMRTGVLTVRESWDMVDALRFLEENGISGAPVVDDQGDLTGVLSLADIARTARPGGRARPSPPAADSDFYRTDLPDDVAARPLRERFAGERITVAEVMTPIVIDAPEDTPIKRLAALMVDLGIHRVIITRDGAAVGIVSAHDLLDLLRGDVPEDSSERSPP